MSVVEFFTLRRAEERVRRYTVDQHDAVALHYGAAERRRVAGLRASDPLAACVLLRQAALSYVTAARLAADPAAHVDLDGAAFPGESRTALDAGGLAARAAVEATDPAYLDRLRGTELRALRRSLERATQALRRAVEPRSRVHIVAARIGRVAGTLLLVVFLAVRITVAVVHPDLAAGKKVTASSIKPTMPDGKELVGGPLGTSYTVVTNTQDDPWVMVDLERVYKLTEIDVYNRFDGWFDDILPIVTETSVDGLHWDGVGRRDTTFAYEPWVVRLAGKPARFVRVRGVGRTSVVLGKLRVYGRP